MSSLFGGPLRPAHIPGGRKRVLEDYNKFWLGVIGMTVIIVMIAVVVLVSVLDLGKNADWFNSPTIVALGITALIAFALTLGNPQAARTRTTTPWLLSGSVIGLGAAIDYLNDLGMDAVAAHEADLLDYATERVRELAIELRQAL